jgi:microcompartment protein CcmL/EutN
MVKAADVKIISKEYVTGALVIIKVMGETAAVKSSVDAGSAAAQRVGELVSSHVIPRPDNQIDSILFDEKPLKKENENMKNLDHGSESSTSEIKKSPIESSKKEHEPKIEKKVIEEPKRTKVEKENQRTEAGIKKIPPMEQLVVLNVHSLRRIARSFEDFPIKGRDISKANRAKLLDYFKNMQ